MKRDNLVMLTIIMGLLFLLNLTIVEASTRKPFKIAVIDTGYSFIPWDNSGFKLCKTGHYDYSTRTATVGEDNHAHGSFVLSLINRHADTRNICFLVYKVFGGRSSLKDVDRAIYKAYKHGAKVINMSLTINAHSHATKNLIRAVTNRGVKIFVAAGNSKKNVNQKCNTYPVCYKGINGNLLRIGALDDDRDVAKYSNYGASIAIYKYGTTIMGSRGTSFASPRAAGDYINSLKLDRRL